MTTLNNAEMSAGWTGVLACPSCRGAIDPALRCQACGRIYDRSEGRPVLRLEGVVPRVEAQALEGQAAARKGQKRTGLGGLADRFREVTTAQIFADDTTQVKLLVDALEGKLPGRRVLEVGAGEQYYLEDLERLGEVVAMDVSVYGPTDVIGDCHALPFQQESFDAVCAIEVLEHLERPWVFFEEVARVLKPGGALFGVTPQYCPTHGFPYDFFRYTKDGLGSLANHAGITLEVAWPIGGPWGTLLHWYWANHARQSPARKVPGCRLPITRGSRPWPAASTRSTPSACTAPCRAGWSTRITWFGSLSSGAPENARSWGCCAARAPRRNASDRQ